MKLINDDKTVNPEYDRLWTCQCCGFEFNPKRANIDIEKFLKDNRNYVECPRCKKMID
ncbi:hypothetical protein [Anaerosolibacter sp.]|uniref:hypothetical protein n=1 Tax=Anaerosolibacter sp. TaxID=1872527 RepID=UPI0039EF6897